MGIEIILLGDKTTHGGEVVTASANVSFMGIPVARVGDMVTCPKCSGQHVIVTGAPFATGHNNQIARHGDKVSCGATLISNGNASGDFIAQQAAATVPVAHSSENVLNDIPPDQQKKLNEEFMKAFKDSYIQTDGVIKMQEQGGWIIKNPNGSYELHRLPPSAPPTSDPNKLSF